VRFVFRTIPDPVGPGVQPRPIVDVVVGGLDMAPQACLIDSGATAVRMGAHVADMIGLDLAGAPVQQIAVGGAAVEGRMAEVSLEIGDATASHRWDAPVWFCEDWRPAFGLLGLTGFFDHFVVTVAACEAWLELKPLDAEGPE
jgi:hypothetical protein